MRWITLLVLAGAAAAQVATQANTGYKTEAGRKQVATMLSAEDRDARQKPKELIEAIGIQRGMTVADVGAGIGYMLPFLSRAVGPKRGRVIAEDIFDDFLAAAKQLVENQRLENVTFVKGTEKDPKLPAGEVDIALVLDVYHHFDYPADMLAGIHKALKPGGKLVIVDFYRRPDAMPNGRAMEHIRADVDVVIKELEANRFKVVSQKEHIPGSQYLLVLEKN